MKKLLILLSFATLMGLLASCESLTEEQQEALDKKVDRAFTKQLIETGIKAEILGGHQGYADKAYQ